MSFVLAANPAAYSFAVLSRDRSGIYGQVVWRRCYCGRTECRDDVWSAIDDVRARVPHCELVIDTDADPILSRFGRRNPE
jgi:hypothetical protein